jgi:chemotaxis protein MotA
LPLIGLVAALYAMYYMMTQNGVSPAGILQLDIVMFCVGGSFAILVMRSSLSDLGGMLRSFGKFVYYKQTDRVELIKSLVELGGINRRDGAIAMQGSVIPHPFLRKSIDMVVDGVDAKEMETALLTEIALTRQREKVHVDLLEFWGEMGPAFGMIGTMIGLVGMMTNMDDIKGIGDMFAVALLTTLWGMIVGYCLCKPWAKKIEGYSSSDVEISNLILEGALLIKAGTNPRVIEERLSSRLAPKMRLEMTDQAAAN